MNKSAGGSRSSELPPLRPAQEYQFLYEIESSVNSSNNPSAADNDFVRE